ncbi:MAG: Asp-tRNA(Asn)/Glu-tRNA(Gln) amidotransferase subunit GatB, partial [Calditrichaeota bacterium]|nr:Asp-tRNA(Asn)/Glu-tRNA(Gln) amidotransferase subunit GatB [Calditrichota bacterium]
MEFEPVIGLEVHAQLSTKTKLWCNCRTAVDAKANSLTCPVCLGLPGSLPVLNEAAVDFAVRFGLAIGAQINHYSEFSRKNYFYQDLPLGYQITQYELPIIENGLLRFEIGEVGEEKYPREVRIERAHIENDTGKTIHDDVITGKDKSFVDFNRAGTPLLEIVTKPDLRSGKEAYYYLHQLRQVLRFIDICDGNMEEGSLRCDANVSIRPVGSDQFGTRAEVKNMNSFRNVEKAINFEIERQKQLILAGKKVVQETRMWDATTSETKSMRSKEDAMDYRYFPEPDLIPLKISDDFIQSIKTDLPELPNDRRDRFKAEYQLS